MKTGRNEPCPCGSGKKYKKCCLRRDEQKADESRRHGDEIEKATDAESSASSDSHGDEYELDKKTEKGESDRIWEDFLESDFERKASTIGKILDDPDLFDEFSCFELFNALHDTCRESNDHRVFKALTQRLAHEYPDRYKKQLGFLLSTLIHDALIEENITEAGEMFLEFAADADADIDYFNTTKDKMAYYAELDLLLKAMRIGWKKVKNSSEIIYWGIDEYANLAVEYEIFAHISEAPDPDLTNPDFLKKLEKYIDPDAEKLKDYQAQFTGRPVIEWQQDDFDYRPKTHDRSKKSKRKKRGEKRLSLETFSENVHVLTKKFMTHLVHEEKYSFPKAQIATSEMRRYLIERVQGKLEKKPSMLELAMNPKLKNKKPPVPNYIHALCPDEKTLDRFMGEMLNLLSFRLHRMIIFYESLPAWLQFLASNTLITPEIHRESMASTSQLYTQIVGIIKKESGDERMIFKQLEKAYSDWT